MKVSREVQAGSAAFALSLVGVLCFGRPFALQSYRVAFRALEVELDKFPTQMVTFSTPTKRSRKSLRKSQWRLQRKRIVTHSRGVCEPVTQGLRKLRLPMTRGLTPAKVDLQCQAFDILRRSRNHIVRDYDKIGEKTPEALKN